MNFYSVWPYFVTIAVVVALMGAPVFSFVDEPVNPSAPRRVHSLDGLRGILAVSVAIHHLVISYRYHFTGIWEQPPSGFYNQLGETSVALFFMVTGYLFWKRLVVDDGKTDLLRLYLGRVFRIAPMYLVVILAMFAVVAHRTHFALNVPLHELFASVGRWLALGILQAPGSLNGDANANLVLAGVTWTIRYEWAFYASLLILFLVARRRTHLPFALGAVVVCAALTRPGVGNAGFCLLFASGMLAASLTVHGLRAQGRIAGMIALVAIAASVHTSHFTYGRVPHIFALFVFFTIVASGNSLFGMLTLRATERLGNVSYSVYLSQGLAITALFGVPAVRAWAYMTPQHYWVCALLCCIGLVIGATLTFRFIEKPAIGLGRRLARKPHRSVPAAG